MKNYFELNYENLHVFGVLGKLEKALQDVASLCKNDNLDFAPVKEERRRKFLAGFYYPPAIDITFDRLPTNGASIVAYSLNKDKTLEVIEEIIGKIGFEVIKPDSQFVKPITSEMVVEIQTYRLTEEMLKSLKSVDFEKIWGVSRYIHLLQHKGYPENKAIKLAARRLSIPDEVSDLFIVES